MAANAAAVLVSAGVSREGRVAAAARSRAAGSKRPLGANYCQFGHELLEFAAAIETDSAAHHS